MRLAVVALLALLTACSSRPPTLPVELPGIPLDVDPTLAISTADGGIAHACAVDGFIITARHVVVDEAAKRYVRDLAWSDGFGHDGFASVVAVSPAIDLAILIVVGEQQPKYLPSGVAKSGDEVFWFEFDFRTRANALRARRRPATVLRVVAQQIILDDVPVGGASGTCLLNARGEVAGIVTAGWDTDDELGAGSAVKLPALPKERE